MPGTKPPADDVREDLTELKIEQAVTSNRLEALEKMMGDFIKSANDSLVTKAEFDAKFWPVKTIVYGLASAVGMFVITAILSKVF